MGLYRRLAGPVLAPSLLLGVASGATVPVQVLAAMHLGASASLAAGIVAVMGGIGLLTTVPAGRLIDRVGDRRAMLLATGGIAVLTLVTVAALVWPGRGALLTFVLASFLRAPAMNVWSLARQAYTADAVETHEVGRAMTALGGMMRIGTLLGPLAGGLLLTRLPVWSVYVFSVLCALAASAFLRPGTGEVRLAGTAHDVLTGPPAAPRPTGPAVAPESEPEPVASPVPSAGTGRRMGPVRRGAVVLAGVAMTALALARSGQPVVVQLWGVAAGLDASAISLVVASGAAVEILLMFPAGYLKDRLGRSPVLAACLVVYGAGFLLLVPLTHGWGVPGLAAGVAVMALGNGLGAGINMTIGADLGPTLGRARFLGIWALFSNVGALGGPSLIAVLVATARVETAIAAVGGVAVTGAAWTVVWARRMGLPSRLTSASR